MPAATLNLSPANAVNEPVVPTVAGDPIIVTAPPISVDPWYRLPVKAVAPGVKPEPAIETPVAMFPATMFAEPKVMAGVPRTVRVVLAVLPAASVTVTWIVPGACVVGTSNPTVEYKSPVAPVTTNVCTIVVDGVVAVFLQSVGTPSRESDCSEFAANPSPPTVTFAPGLTAVSVSSFGSMV